MKTYKELEREAYITGNTALAKLYAAADDSRISDGLRLEIDDLRERCDFAESRLEEIAELVRYV